MAREHPPLSSSCSPVRGSVVYVASSAALSFLHATSARGTGDALQPLRLWTGQGFARLQAAPSGRGSLVYGVASQRGFRCPSYLAFEAPLRCVLWRGFALSAPPHHHPKKAQRISSTTAIVASPSHPTFSFPA
jgi:hypothetical protein